MHDQRSIGPAFLALLFILVSATACVEEEAPLSIPLAIPPGPEKVDIVKSNVISHRDDPNSGLEGEVRSDLFGTTVPFVVEDEATLEYVEACAGLMNSLSVQTLRILMGACDRYRRSFLEAIGEPVTPLDSPEDILRLIKPAMLIVPYPEHGPEPVVHMELNCQWEVEHGMEWVVRGDEVLYVGAFNGEDPWDDFSTKEFWNYAQ